jgi:hypothetical protein
MRLVVAEVAVCLPAALTAVTRRRSRCPASFPVIQYVLCVAFLIGVQLLPWAVQRSQEYW